MNFRPCILFLLGISLMGASARVRVVINEIYYHAPAGIDDLEYIELHNAGDQPVDVTGWKFTKGIELELPLDTRLEPRGYLVVCKNLPLLRRYFNATAAATFEQSLKNEGERLEPTNAAGEVVDR